MGDAADGGRDFRVLLENHHRGRTGYPLDKEVGLEEKVELRFGPEIFNFKTSLRENVWSNVSLLLT